MKRTSAFTLVELLVALTILATGILSLVLIRNSQLERLQATLERSQARELALEELGQLACDPATVENQPQQNRTVGGLLVRRSIVKTWTEHVPINLVTVEVERAAVPGQPIATYALQLAEPPKEATENATP